MENGYGTWGLNICRKKTVCPRFKGDGNFDGSSNINLQVDNLKKVATLNIWDRY